MGHISKIYFLNIKKTMKLWAFFAVFAVAAEEENAAETAIKAPPRTANDLARDLSPDDGAVRGERGTRDCKRERLEDVNGVTWTCSARTTKKSGGKRNKKCRAKCTKKREQRHGVKKITCKPKIGWVEKGTETKYDPTSTYCDTE